MLKAYLVFALLFNSYALLFIEQGILDTPPWPLVVSRDLIWILFSIISLVAIFIKRRHQPEWFIKFQPYYRHLGAWFFLLSLPYFIVMLAHVYNRGLMDVMQFDLRNTYYYVVTFFWIPLYINDRQQLIDLFHFLFHTVWLTFIVCIFYIFSPSTLLFGRVASSFGDPNNYGYYLNFIICLGSGWYLLQHKIKRQRLVIMIAAVLLLLTASMGSYLLLTGIVLIQLLMRRRLGYAALLICFATICAYIGIEWLELDVLQEKLDALLYGGRTVTYRVTQYYEMWDFITTSNLWTLGLGEFGLDYYRKYDTVYFNLLRNDGLGILLIFIGICSYFTVLAHRLYRQALQHKDLILAGIWQSLFIFLLASLIFSYPVHPLLFRFPLNFFTYLFFTLILIGTKSSAFTKPATTL